MELADLLDSILQTIVAYPGISYILVYIFGVVTSYCFLNGYISLMKKNFDYQDSIMEKQRKQIADLEKTNL